MQDLVEAAAAKAAPKMDRAAFDARMVAVRAEFDGLLDDEALALLVLDELGLNEGAVLKVAELRGRDEATVVVEVVRIHPAREFPREPRVTKAEDGTVTEQARMGRVVNVDVRDATGTARLVLWGRDSRHVDDGDLRPGSRVKIVNARVKDSTWGLELHATAWTKFEIDGALDPAKRKLLMDTRTDYDPLENRATAPTQAGAQALLDVAPEAPVATFAPLGRLTRDRPAVDARARLLALGPTRTFQRKDGSIGFVANATLEDATGRAQLVCWDEAVRDIRKVGIGAEFTIRDAQVRDKDGRLELHTTRSSRFET